MDRQHEAPHMKLLTWNIQWGLGCDGQVDLRRIAGEARRICDADVFCFQEVSAGFEDLAGNDGADQFTALAGLFEGYAAISFAAVDMPGPKGRRRFGNMVLSRLPVGQVVRHALPWDAAGVECMPRGALDVVVDAPAGPLRVITTHLEWSSPALRGPQVDALRECHRLAARRAADPPLAGKGPYDTGPGSAQAVLCGDFNMTPGDPLLARLQSPFDAPGVPQFCDAWRLRNPGAAHPPSMCLHHLGGGPARCLDYVFVTAGLGAPLVAITYDASSDASDHQALVTEFA